MNGDSAKKQNSRDLWKSRKREWMRSYLVDVLIQLGVNKSLSKENAWLRSTHVELSVVEIGVLKEHARQSPLLYSSSSSRVYGASVWNASANLWLSGFSLAADLWEEMDFYVLSVILLIPLLPYIYGAEQSKVQKISIFKTQY